MLNRNVGNGVVIMKKYYSIESNEEGDYSLIIKCSSWNAISLIQTLASRGDAQVLHGCEVLIRMRPG